MRKTVRRIGILVAALAAVSVLAVAALVLLVDAESFRPAIEAGLSETLGRPVSLGKLGLRPGLGLWVRADSLEIAEAEDGSARLAFHAEDLGVRLGLLALLRGEVNARKVRFERGVLRDDGEVMASGLALSGKVRRDADGIVSFSGSVEGRADVLDLDGARLDLTADLEGDRLAVREVVARAGPAVLRADGAISGLTGDAPEGEFEARGQIGATEFLGSFRILTAGKRTRVEFSVSSPFVDFDEISDLFGWVEAGEASERASGFLVPVARAAGETAGTEPEPVPLDAEGTIRADRARFAGLELTGLETRVDLQRGVLLMDDARFALYGGSHDGSLRARLEEEGLPFELRSDLEGVDVEALLKAFSPDSGGAVRGTGAVRLRVTGRAADEGPEGTVRGTARLQLTDGALTTANLLSRVFSALDEAGSEPVEARETPFERFSADFDIRDRAMTTSNLEFRSADLDLDGAGTVGFDLSLALEVTASVSPEGSVSLVRQVPQLEFRVGRDGRLTLPMRIDGDLLEPRVGIDLRRVLEEGLGRRRRDKLRGLFGGR